MSGKRNDSKYKRAKVQISFNDISRITLNLFDTPIVKLVIELEISPVWYGWIHLEDWFDSNQVSPLLKKQVKFFIKRFDQLF